jgi:hypothetical protein
MALGFTQPLTKMSKIRDKVNLSLHQAIEAHRVVTC